jgi:two-component system, OmpR family, sensor histidine kinase SenX3
VVSGQLVVLALAFGIAVGAVFTWLLIAAAQRGRRVAELDAQQLPDGVAPVLEALDLPAVMLDGSNTVLLATPAAGSLGLIAGRRLAHAELDGLSDAARAAHAARNGDYVLRRGTIGPPAMHLLARAAPMGLRHVLLVAEDRSDAVRLEAVRRDFVANVSHELKTPIGAVGLLAEALQTAADDPDQVRRFADRLSAEAVRLGLITREIIDFSRLQAVDPLHEPTRVGVDGVLASAVDQNHVLAQARGVELVLAKRTGLDVLGDEGLLTTAVHNLVANALQYSPPHSRVGIGARSRNGVVEITVTDQGAGIAPEDLERVFERFYRADPARSRQTGGTGLGLSIVKHVAQNHGGDVIVWSRLGHGSTFTIRLPEAPEGHPAAPKRREKERV